jgi:hypothetical protein
MYPILRLYEDIISGSAVEVQLPAQARMIFVVHGAATVAGKTLGDGEASQGQVWHGEGATTIKPGKDGATLWRFELTPPGGSGDPIAGPGTRSLEKLAAVLETVPQGELLMRGDSVAFPPGGCAFLHRHAGPGIRCLIEGGIRIDTRGRSTSYGPGGAWYETGPDPVFAQSSAEVASRFVRVLILPRALIGKSSISYVKEEDKAKPKTQSYKVYADAPIEFGGKKK